MNSLFFFAAGWSLILASVELSVPPDSPLDSHSGQKKPAGSTWQLVYIFGRPTLPGLKMPENNAVSSCWSKPDFRSYWMTSPSQSIVLSYLQHTLIWWGLLDFGYLAHLFAKQNKESICHESNMITMTYTVHTLEEELKWRTPTSAVWWGAHLCYLWRGFCFVDVAQYMGPVLEVNTNLWAQRTPCCF